MKRTIDVQTGRVGTGHGGDNVYTGAIGSCIAVVLYDNTATRGGIAHIMLPGEAPRPVKDGRHFRYASDGIKELMGQMVANGSNKQNIRACMAGGGNVLERPDDTICESNIASVRNILEKEGIAVAASCVGGSKRRRVRLDTGTGICYCACGDGPEDILCRFKQ